MLPFTTRAAGAASLLVIALCGFAYAGDAVVPPTSTPPIDPAAAAFPGPAGDGAFAHRQEKVAELTTSPFVRKNRLICGDGGAGTPGSILFDNEGPGTLTIGMTVKVVIQPTGKVISYVLPYDLPPHTGVIWYDAYRPGTANVTCAFTATAHEGERTGTPHPWYGHF